MSRRCDEKDAELTLIWAFLILFAISGAAGIAVVVYSFIS